jgi:hypothetical protein
MTARRLPAASALGLLLAVASPAVADPFLPGNLVVVRVGDGSGSLDAFARPVFLDEYATTGGSRVQALALPTTPSGGNRELTLTGNGSQEGYLTLSADGQFLALAGYAVSVGSTTAAGVPTGFGGTADRAIARVGATGVVDTTTVLTNAYAAGPVRSVVSVDGSQYWVSGGSRVSGDGANSGGVNTIGHGGTTATRINNTVNDTRSLRIFNGQLYVSTGPPSAVTISAVGTGLPTQPEATFVAFTTPGLNAPRDFILFDLDQNGVVDRMYVADERTNNSGGLERWVSTDGSSWTRETTFVPANNTGLRGLTGQLIGGVPTLFGTTAITTASGNQLVSFVDDGVNTAFTVLATADTNTAFRGVAFTPSAVPEPTALVLTALGGCTAWLLGRRQVRRRKG